MKVDLYATEHEQGWRLHVSLDMRIDSLWWTATNKRGYSCRSLWHIASDLPVGWAFACVRHFNGRLQHQKEATLPAASFEQNNKRHYTSAAEATIVNASAMIEQIRQWLSEYITARQSIANEFYSRGHSFLTFSVGPFASSKSAPTSTQLQLVFPCTLWTRERGWTGSGQYVLSNQGGGQLQGDVQQIDRKKQLTCGAIALTGLLNGRSLLLPELHHLMDEQQSPYTAGWRSYLQLAYLQKHIRLLDSVYVSSEASTEDQQSDNSWSFLNAVKHSIGLSSHQHTACRRCGSTSIRYTSCAGCGSSACGYCEECLMMGRSRECGLLLQSVRPPIADRITEQTEQKRISQRNVAQPSRTAHALFVVAPFAAQSASAGLQGKQQSSLQSSLACTEGKKDIQARWGLSNAQTAAALQALSFLQTKVEDVASPQLTPSLLWQISKAYWHRCQATLMEAKGHLQRGSDDSTKRTSTTEMYQEHIINDPSAYSTSHSYSIEDVDSPGIQDGLRQMDKLPRSRRFLLWAVTGAGKTEMIFPLIDYMLQKKQHVLIATPRRDVVLELAPRLRQAFPSEQVVALYGGSDEQWTQGAITIATTHQLLRYHAAFDLVIIDEIDAFPYDGNPMLAYGAYTACRPDGKFVYLSATPSDALQRAIRQGQLAHAKVPVRFHGHPLPVPKRMKTPSFVSWYGSGKLPMELLQQVQHSIERGAQLFWFMPRIAWIEPMVTLLKEHFPMLHIAGTSSEDEQRAQKVVQFRERRIRILVTTTILERGVTVPGSDVYIIDAHDHVYHASALIQMAGRAGRSKQDPAGKVIFTASEYGRSQKQAIGQIRLMNRIARKQNYIVSSVERN